MPYHHGNLREALVAAGAELAAEQGPEAVALREVSRRVGVSHNAAYRHFSDREALLGAVTARALTAFGLLMQTRIAEAGGRRGRVGAWERLDACGRAYVEFAVTQPGLFRMCFGERHADADPDSDVPHAYVQLADRLDELVRVGAVTAARREQAAVGAWSAVHGFATLVLDGPLARLSPTERDRGLAEVLRVVREGI